MAACPRGHRPARTLYRVRAGPWPRDACPHASARTRGHGPARTREPVRADAVFTASACKTASAGKCGRARTSERRPRTSGRKGRPDGHFHPKTSFMTPLMSQWHIARISHRSSCKCHAQQAATNFKCTARIAKGSKGTTAPTYQGRNTQYGGTKVIVSDFWFCPDDIERCVKGSKRSWVLDWPQVPDVWPILSSTNLTREETILLQDAGFKLQERPSMSPRRMFVLSNHFEAPIFDHPDPPNPNVHPSTRNSKSVRRNANAPTAEYRNIKRTVFGVTVLPFLGLGAIISLESGVEPDKVYRITISHFPECTCPDFLNMVVASIGKQGQYVNCKHLYYIFRYFCKMNCQDDKFIHSSSLSFIEVKQLLIRA
jgi:hypothetical protein